MNCYVTLLIGLRVQQTTTPPQICIIDIHSTLPNRPLPDAPNQAREEKEARPDLWTTSLTVLISLQNLVRPMDMAVVEVAKEVRVLKGVLSYACLILFIHLTHIITNNKLSTEGKSSGGYGDSNDDTYAGVDDYVSGGKGGKSDGSSKSGKSSTGSYDGSGYGYGSKVSSGGSSDEYGYGRRHGLRRMQ